ncbi:MAG: (2Fe-2S)-binding protein [bacterium]
MKRNIAFTINGTRRQSTVDDERTLLWFLRTDLGLTGCKFGCGEGYCGACTVLVNGEAVRSCQARVKDIEGKEVITIEGLAADGTLHPLQKAFIGHDALQCGYCTPGMILTAYTLLMKNQTPSREEILDHMDNNLCRCGSHARIVQAIQAAGLEMKGGKNQ